MLIQALHQTQKIMQVINGCIVSLGLSCFQLDASPCLDQLFSPYEDRMKEGEAHTHTHTQTLTVVMSPEGLLYCLDLL